MGLKRQNISSRTTADKQQSEFYSEVSLLCEHSSGRNVLILKLLASTGLTPSELVNLQVRDIQEDSITIRSETTRNATSRTLFLNTRLARQLRTHALGKSEEDFIFSTRQSPQLTTRRVEQIFIQACKSAQLKTSITPRDLRNAYLVQAAKKAVSDEELKELTGLKTITKKDTLTPKEQQRFLETAKKHFPREFALTTLLLDSGIALSEALQLQKKDLARNSVRLSRGVLEIQEHTAQLLKELVAERTDEEYIFSSRQSSQLTLRRAEQVVQEISQQAKVPSVTSHTLRATAIERIAREKGVDQAQLHAGLKSSLRYLYGHIDSRSSTFKGGAP